MKLVYHCANCAARNEFDMPKSISLKYGAADVLDGIDGVKVNMWVRRRSSRYR